MSPGTSPSFGRCSSLAANIAWKVAGGGGRDRGRGAGRGKGSCTEAEEARRGSGGDGDCAGWKKLPPFEARGGI